MVPDPKAVIVIGQRLEEAKALVFRLQEQWDALFMNHSAPKQKERSSRPIQTGSASSKIDDLLRSNPDFDYSPNTIAREIGVPIGTTRTTLSKKVKKGTIEKRGTGTYGWIRKTQEKETLSLVS